LKPVTIALPLAVFTLLLAPVISAQAQTPSPNASLRQLLAQGPIPAAGKPGFVGHLGVLVQDAQSGRVLFESNSSQAFTPASVMKVMTSAASLYTLGPRFQFETALLVSEIAPRTARLTWRGSGDPTITSQDLAGWAKAAAGVGISQVAELRVDDSAFDHPRWASGWMWDDEAEPIGAAFLDGADSPYISFVEKPNPQLLLDPSAYPLALAGMVQAEWAKVGLKIDRLAAAKAEQRDTVLATHRSQPLATIVRAMNKWSENRYAEQLYAHLGLGLDTSGNTIASTPARSTAALAAFLKQAGVTDGWRVRDGSGLSRYNLFSPQQVASVLRYAYQNPLTTDGSKPSPLEAFNNKSNVFIESLPVAGTGEANDEASNTGGTLRNRLVGSGLDVRAKTGSMTGIASLAGYVKANSGRVIIFTMLMDNYPGPIADLRALQDAMVKVIAKY
jgi:serine-type D-Ala-D-Ala carboxypeptidase/endopeptidase (penicillin-binding protein 4)